MKMTLETKVLLVRAFWGFIVGSVFSLVGEPANLIKTPLPSWAFNLVFLILLYFPSALLAKYVGASGMKAIITKGFIVYISVALLTWIAFY